jgi:hypothetical protein
METKITNVHIPTLANNPLLLPLLGLFGSTGLGPGGGVAPLILIITETSCTLFKPVMLRKVDSIVLFLILKAGYFLISQRLI